MFDTLTATAIFGALLLSGMLKVAAGVDSMVLGEPQILGQLKKAYAVAVNAGAVGQHFQSLFPTVFNITKKGKCNFFPRYI